LPTVSLCVGIVVMLFGPPLYLLERITPNNSRKSFIGNEDRRAVFEPLGYVTLLIVLYIHARIFTLNKGTSGVSDIEINEHF